MPIELSTFLPAKSIAAEKDTAALKELSTAKDELKDAIASLRGQTKDEVDALLDVDLVLASAGEVAEVSKALGAIKASLDVLRMLEAQTPQVAEMVALAKTDLAEKIEAAKISVAKAKESADKARSESLAKIEAKTFGVIRYEADGPITDVNHQAIFSGAAVNMTIGEPTKDRAIVLIRMTGVAPVITAPAGVEFVVDKRKSTDSQLLLDKNYSAGLLLGNGVDWDFVPYTDPAIAPVEAATYETIVLATLPANTWTGIQLSAVNAARPVIDIGFQDAGGERINLAAKVVNGVYLVHSALELTDVQVTVEF